MPDLESLLARLSAAKVRYVVVGGFAAVAHGVSLVTQDLDICCDFTVANLLRLQQSLADLHPVHRMTPRRIPLELSKDNAATFKNLYLDTDLGQLDCLSQITGVGGYDQVKRHSIRLKLPWGYCHVLGIEALIKGKEAMGRPRDRQAARQLQVIRQRQSPRPS
jgi:hypothetical protein